MMNRRQSMGSLVGGAAAAALAGVFAQGARAAEAAAGGRGKFHHSVCRWCFNKIPFDDFCREAKNMGIESVELLAPKEWEPARKNGMTCAMGMIPPRNGIGGIPKGFNRVEHHDTLFALFSESIEQAAKAGVPNIVIFSGNRDGMDLETGLNNCAEGLKRLMPVAEKHGVCLQHERDGNRRRADVAQGPPHDEDGARLALGAAQRRPAAVSDWHICVQRHWQ